ncbi:MULTISPECIES: hypothetical protein [Pantoea]|nr:MULTISPECIES: hypothetical protein [Pantoea]
MTDRQKSIQTMIKLASRLNAIVAEMQARKDIMLAEQARKAA